MTIDHAGKEVLVLGATGTVGEHVVRATMATGARVRALVRHDSRRAKLPAGVLAVTGDLRDEPSLERAAAGVRAIFYVSPHEPDEEDLADRVLRVCEKAKARLVFVGVHIDGGWRATRAVKRFLYGRVLRHYAPKFRLSERARRARDAVILMPTNFFQNDELVRDEIERGRFCMAFERPVNRVDVRDLGEAAARALLDDSVAPGAYPVVGPKSLTGAECASTWSDVLGTPIVYDTDRARFEEALARAVSGKKRDDFRASFDVLRGFELATEPADVERTKALLGRAPTSYRDYVERTAACRA